MRFKIQQSGDCTQGKLSYIKDDYAFAFYPRSSSSITSIVIDTIMLPIDKDGNILSVYGYCPYFSWKEDKLIPPDYTKGNLAVELPDITPGVSERLTQQDEGNICYDRESGWICVGSKDLNSNDYVSVEFASGCVAVLEKDKFRSLWLHPVMFPEL